MSNITFVNDDDFAPVFGVSGSIVIKQFRTYAPTLDGDVKIYGSLVIKIPRPKPLQPQAGQMVVQGHLKAGVKSPAAAFKDFSHYPYLGVDPAMARIGITSGAMTSGAAGAYTRPYAAFTGPMSYPVSGSGYAWKRAAYAAVGFKFNNMSSNKHQILDAVQFEPLPVGATGPSAYQNARTVQVVIKPTRLNYAPNPNFESGVSGMSVLNTATVAADSVHWGGTQSCKVTVPANLNGVNGGFNFKVTGLIPGRRYTMSAYAYQAQYCGRTYAWTSGSSSTLVDRNTFDTATPDPRNKRWRRLWVTFTANIDTVWMGFSVPYDKMTPNQPSIFWVDGVLVEEGDSVRPYFDGSMGADYLWETGGTTNLARSYYYENRVERSYLIRTLLDENTPLGISAAIPQYAVLPTQ
jgi:hypothetical protein